MISSMGEEGAHGKLIGNYIATKLIGTGSFAVVWRAKHRLTDKEVAIKEIATDRLNKKLQESLESEIAILQRINHPNIIKLHEIIKEFNQIYLVLEYCSGGDLAAYIQKCGRVPQRLARHFMQQLGAGLLALCANNLIHRDLKPQNLLLSSREGDAVLKIADFGFARSLQPLTMAKTLCGSPLYMAPEILQGHKYDAKADLWSVGAILFQLVTGQPPFVGDNHHQLLQNILKSNELRFPEAVIPALDADCVDLCQKLLRKNPVERLPFKEFFNHKFLTLQTQQQSKFEVGSTYVINESQEDFQPFERDEEPQHSSNYKQKAVLDPLVSHIISQRIAPGNLLKKGVLPINEGFEAEIKTHIKSSKPSTMEDFNICSSKPLPYEEPLSTNDVGQGLNNMSSFRGSLSDSLERIESEYVLVNAPVASTETLSSFLGEQSSEKSTLQRLQRSSTPSIQVPSYHSQGGCSRTPGIHLSLPSETPKGSLDSAEVLGTDNNSLPTRLLSLQNYAWALSELSSKKLELGEHLEAFAIQLVCLGIWRDTLRVCHKWAEVVSGGDLSPIDDIIGADVVNVSQWGVYIPPFFERADRSKEAEAAAACARMEEEFFSAVQHAEELASQVTYEKGTEEMPDAMEIIFQSALAIGRNAAVDELMDNPINAASDYAKAATMMHFLAMEAGSLSLNPPLILSPADRQRLDHYIDALTSRQSQCIAHREILILHP